METDPNEVYCERMRFERKTAALVWLRGLPRFPANVHQVDIVLRYDDGASLEIEAVPKEEPDAEVSGR